MASPTTPAAGTVQESVRSRNASAGFFVSVSTERNGFAQRRQWLHRRAHDQRPAGGHPALGASRPGLCGGGKPCSSSEDLVVGLRADAAPDVEAVSDRDPLHGVDRHQHPPTGHRDAVPRDMGAEPGDERRKRGPRRRHRGSRCSWARSISATIASPSWGRNSAPATRRRTASPAEPEGIGLRGPLPSRSGARGCTHVTPSARRKAFARAASRHSRRRFACAGTLEHVPHVPVAVLEDTGRGRRDRAGQVNLLHPAPRPARD